MEDRRVLATIDLAALAAAQGISIFGAEVHDFSGFSVSSAGDVNGDGYDDVVIGARLADAAGNVKLYAGDSYVVFGRATPQSTIDLANLGSAGITIFGADAVDFSGWSVSGAGDLNGDGFDDVLIGAHDADGAGNNKSGAGDSYVIFGGASLPSTISLGNLNAGGVTIFGADAGDYSGGSVSSAGDVNGDGYDDLIIGAYRGDASANAKSNVGESYLIFGRPSFPPSIDLANLGSAGVTIFGADIDDQSGAVSGAGDVNGDGFDDILIGAFAADAFGNAKQLAGESYLIFGAASLPATIDLANLGSAGVSIYGADAGDYSGASVSSAGDVNGDGFDDLIIGARRADASGNAKSQAGDSYIIFGAETLPTRIDLSVLGTSGVTIFGVDSNDQSGVSVSAAGDINGDGFDDVIIGASGGDALGNAKSNAGESYVFLGGASLPLTIDLANLNAAGITIFGADVDDTSGGSAIGSEAVSSAGDLNGDGFDDLIVGSYRGDGAGNAKNGAGESYVIFGGNFTSSVTQLGTSLGNTLTGTAAGDILNGAGGNDLLIGNGGSDVLIGGQGDDILAFSNSFKRIIGGSGNDTLRVDGSRQSWNFTSGRNSFLRGIEQIDITGSGDNYLEVNLRGVLNISDESNTLVVRRNAGDIVDIGSGWSQVADEAIGGILFNVYTQGAARLKVQFTNWIDLSTLTARQGSILFGADAGDQSGLSVSNAGDVNGDGFDDLIIGAPLADALGNTKVDAGESYVVFGGTTMSATIDLGSLGSAGFTIFGGSSKDLNGFSVSSAGDVNGDGFDDLLIGAKWADGVGEAKNYSGESYVIFGGTSIPPVIDLSNLNSPNVTIFGADFNDVSGTAVSGAGDVNGDGFDDLIVGTPGGDGSANTKLTSGESYVIFGSNSLPAAIDLSNLGAVGITIYGANASEASGLAVSSAGDVNGDGFDDLVVGAMYANQAVNSRFQAGESYLIFGAAALPQNIDLSNLGSIGTTIYGASKFARSSKSISSAGDVNGDGFDDVIIGAYFEKYTGVSYVVFGGATLPSSIELATLGAAGVVIPGEGVEDQSGFSVSCAGDVNGDGFDDLLVSSPGVFGVDISKTDAGRSYVVFGGSSLPSTINLKNVSNVGMVVFGADKEDTSGSSLSNAGDVNGDGFDDIIIGAQRADAAGNAKAEAGESYLIFGGNFSTAITHQGTATNETILGTVIANTINGAGGNDILVGNGGADVLIGGQGNDTLGVSDLNFKRIVGGTGTDTLRLDGSGLLLNLTALRDNRILGIEQIDISGAGNNALTLNQREVLNISDESNTLVVFRDADDLVDIGTGWSPQTIETIGLNVFSVYRQGNAVLKVQNVARTIDLAALTSSQATTIFGADAEDDSGFSVSNAGDVNGDGFDDMIIGARWADGSGNTMDRAGESYLVYGAATLPHTIDLANLGSGGVTLFGSKSQGLSGHVSSAGDVNGDGYDDIIIGAIWANAAAGESYILFGSPSLPSIIELGSLGAAGVTLFGANSDDRSGHVSSAGDVNGDGFDDLIIGAYMAEGTGGSSTPTGVTYVIFGGSSLPVTIDLANLGAAGITILGVDSVDDSGWAVSSAGDMNGDGFADLIIGAMFADALGNAKPNAGESYIIFGGTSLPQVINLAVPGSASITIYGDDPVDNSGWSVDGAGDVNGDGFDDVIIGAPLASAAGNLKQNAGGAYVVFGGSTLPATIDLGNLGSQGITFFGANAEDITGATVSGAGDVNGDGFDDLIIGAYFADAMENAKADAGESYVIYGGLALPATVDLNDLVTLGITIFGADADDRSGSSVSKAGDVNGDGFDDFFVGSRLGDAAQNAKSNAGESYILFGNNFTASVTHQGTPSGDSLNGTSTANVMNGGRGNDILAGYGGADVIIGGQGNDVLAYTNTFKRIIGGTGLDTVRMDGGGEVLNLINLKDNRIRGIEQIDITGSGNNTLILNFREVLNISDESNTLTVRRNAGDIVNFGSGWSQVADEVIGGVLFNVYAQGTARLKVQFNFIIDLSVLTSRQGITIFGAEADDYSGLSVSNAGDMNGDGFDDLVVGARRADGSGNTKTSSGESYVIFGAAILPTTIDLASLGSAGITIWGVDAGDMSGSVSSAGDVNGDGFDDLLIGARNGDASGNSKIDAGESYVIFGAASLPATIDLANLGSGGTTIFGVDASDGSGISVSRAGDINGDGFDDIAIGARRGDASGNAKPNAGESYVIFGAAALPTTIDLASLGSAGITIFGVDAVDYSGSSVGGAGDVNGDGLDDLIIGALLADASGNSKRYAGESYVLFGATTLPATVDLRNLGAAGVTVFGADINDSAGISVKGAGDFNGDGFDDLVIGANWANGAGNAESYAGESYLIFGATTLPSTIDLNNLGAAGVTFFGADPSDFSGYISGAGDVNGDGFDDLIIGADRADASGEAKLEAGESYVIFGGTSFPTTIDLANIGSSGLTIFGADSADESGKSVSNAGDVNGDGFDDLLIGATGADAAGNAKSASGESYLIYGNNFTASITHQGTSAADTLTGTVATNLMNGGMGNDTLVGNGGSDILIGGQGNDVLAVGDLSFKRIVGGTGTDTLRLDGSGLTFDLTTLSDNRILGIEQIDITGSGNNTLTLNLREVLNLSDESNTLTVFRNAGDVVNFGTGWTQGADQTTGINIFQVYLQGAARLKVLSTNRSPLDIAISSNSVAENAAIGAFVGAFSSTDPDSGDTFSYSLVPGDGSTDNTSFAMVGSELKTNAVFNFETKNTYSIRVRSTDLGGLAFEKSFLINVSDVNEAPALLLTNIVTSVAESNTLGLDVAHVAIQDDALGTNAISLSGPDVAMFELSAGKLKLKPSFLDFESKAILQVTISVDDPTVGTTPDQSIDVVLNVIDVNEAPGILLTNLVTSVPESNMTGLNVADVTINDDALGTNTISLSGPDAAMFEVSGGKLKLKPSSLDFETKPTLRVTVSVDDPTVGSTPDQSIDVVLNVTDVNEVPGLLLSNLVTSVPESNTAGLNVADVAVKDDALGTNTIRLSGPDAAMFEVSGGKLKLKPSSLDFETKPVLRVTVSVDDPTVGSTPDQAIDVVLNVTDVNEAPGLLLSNLVPSVPESNTAGLNVADVEIKDDALGTNSISLSGPDAAMFEVSGGKLKLKPSALDFETKPTLRVTISVDDATVGSTPDQAIDVVLNITDVNEAPGVTLTNLVTTVPESNTAGLSVADITINDDALGANTITLSGPDVAKFEVSGGKLKLRPSSLDFETKPTLRVTISVDDSTVGSTPDQAIDVVLNVTDVNEVPGLLLTNRVASVPESNTAGLTVADVAVVDDALGTNTITLSGPDAALFDLSGGKLRLKPSSLDFETKPTLRVTVSVDDPTVGSTPDQAVDVVLNVTDVNEAPSFTLTSVVSSVLESNSTSVNIADIVLRDDALGANTVSLTGPDAAFFQVVGSKLVLKPSSLDFETKPTLRVTVSVDDPTVGNSPDQSTNVVLNVTDVNEAPTDVVFSNVLLRMAEESTLQQAITVADISVTDDALGTNELSLRGVDAQYFEITNNKLVLKAGARFNFEAQSIFQVRVTAIDPQLTDSEPVYRDYVLNIDNVAEVSGVTVIDGQGWTDSVRQIQIRFDTLVNLTNSAIEWSKKDIGGVSVPIVVQTSVVNNRTVADVRFQGKYVDAVGLLDGSYDLLMRGDQVTVAATGIPGLTYTESFLAVRPKPTFAMNITLAPSVNVGVVTSLAVQLVGANGTGIRYDIDLDGDGVIDRTITSGTAITLNDVVFTQGGSRTVLVTATRNGVTLGRNSAVIDVVPYTVRGSRWLSTLDVDADETVSPLDVLGVINWLNDTSSDRRYALNLDVDRDASISPLDVLAIINHINVEGSGTSPTPFVSLAMNDAGASDGLTDNVGIQGRAKETNARLFLSLDGSPRREAVGAIGADGAFDLTDAAIAQLFGSSLEGDHLLTIGALGSDGSWRGMDRRFSRTSRSLNPFELTTALQNGGLSLAWTSAGSGARYRVMQSIAGQSPAVLADSLVVLSTRIDLPIGVYDLFIEAYDILGRKQSSPIVRVRMV